MSPLLTFKCKINIKFSEVQHLRPVFAHIFIGNAIFVPLLTKFSTPAVDNLAINHWDVSALSVTFARQKHGKDTIMATTDNDKRQYYNNRNNNHYNNRNRNNTDIASTDFGKRFI